MMKVKNSEKYDNVYCFGNSFSFKTTKNDANEHKGGTLSSFNVRKCVLLRMVMCNDIIKRNSCRMHF